MPVAVRTPPRRIQADAAEAQHQARRHDEARATVREAFAACLLLAGLEKSQAAHDLLEQLAQVADQAQALQTAHDAWERVCRFRDGTLPDDHPDLQRARQNLAIMRGLLGDLPGALALAEQVYAVRSQSLPDAHPDLQQARENLAITKAKLGDLRGALACRSGGIDSGKSHIDKVCGGLGHLVVPDRNPRIRVTHRWRGSSPPV